MFAAPVLAFAVTAPASTPTPVVSEGFESASPSSRVSLDWVVSIGEPTPAFWGRVTAKKHAGSYALWCAGKVPNDSWTTTTTTTFNAWTVGTAWADFFGRYPDYTKGLADISVPELAEYYSSWLEYWYVMPSVGGNDGGAFNVKFGAAPGGYWQTDTSQATTSTWAFKRYPLTLPVVQYGPRVNLSRTPGVISFQFVDDVGVYEPSPTNGEGPTIDDVTITGFKFGPVRDLLAQVNSGQVYLDWRVPARSTVALAADEERPIAYRVWRSPDTAPYVWTELTDLPLESSQFVDTAPLDGGARYVVQASDPVPGSGYGEVDLTSGATVFIVPPIPTTDIHVDGGAPDEHGVYTELPTILVTRSSSKGATFYRWDAGGWVSTTAQTFNVPSMLGTHTLEAYSVNSLGDPETLHQMVFVVDDGMPDETTPPVTTRVGSTWAFYAAPAVVSLSATDSGGSGVLATYYTIDGGSPIAGTTVSIAATGTHTVQYWSVDLHGNVETAKSMTFTVITRPTGYYPSQPVVAATVKKYPTKFTTYGYVKFHTAGTYPVTLKFYRYKSGSYVYYKSVTAKVSTIMVPGTDFSKYSASTTLPYTGKWRVRAMHTSGGVNLYSPYSYLTVY